MRQKRETEKKNALSGSMHARKRERERDVLRSDDASAEGMRGRERCVGRDRQQRRYICFKHILPRLNRTDVKFLFEVNTETRALVKRSSRRDDLKKGFKVSEMSSTSTMEFARENRSLWPRWWYKSDFCNKVAQTNKKIISCKVPERTAVVQPSF